MVANHFRFANAFASSRARSMNSWGSGLSVRFLSVMTPICWCVLPLKKALGRERDPVQCVAHAGELFPATLGDDEALTLAIEQLDAQLRLKRLHLIAHRALRDE